MEPLVTLDEVVRVLPYSKVHIYRLIKDEKFPTPRKLGAKTVWFEHEIQAYIDALPKGVAERPAQPGKEKAES